MINNFIAYYDASYIKDFTVDSYQTPVAQSSMFKEHQGFILWRVQGSILIQAKPDF